MLNLLLNNLKTVFFVVVTAIIAFAIGKNLFPKTVTHTVNQPVTTVVHDSVHIHDYIEVLVHDTIRPAPNIIEKIVERVVPADTVVIYEPISATDSSVLSRMYAIMQLKYNGGDLSLNAWNPSQRTIKHFAWSDIDPNFQLGANSQEVWLLEHYQWIKWNGIKLGGSWNFPGGYLFAEPSVTFFKRLNLDAGLTSTLKPFEVRLSYEVLQ